MSKKVAALILAACTTAAAAGPAQAATLDEVRERGELICGIDGGLPGFSAPNDAGQMAGIDADVCYALAAASRLASASLPWRSRPPSPGRWPCGAGRSGDRTKPGSASRP